MKRQFAIASAGRTASTSLYQSIINTLAVSNSVYPIWDFSPTNLLAQAYAGDRYDHVVVKGETFHFIDHLRFQDRTTLILLTRRDQFKQIVSHLVSLHAGRFHATNPNLPAYPRPQPFRVERHEFLFVANLVLMMDIYFTSHDFTEFDSVERWCFEDLVAGFESHLQRLGLNRPRLAQLRGVDYDENAISNLDEVRAWSADLGTEGLRLGPATAEARL